MTRSVVISQPPGCDMVDAHAWYERKALGLGAQFLGEIDVQIARITATPEHFPEVLAGVRRARLRRFPYGLFFRDETEGLFVIACFHSSREPMVWQSRV